MSKAKIIKKGAAESIPPATDPSIAKKKIPPSQKVGGVRRDYSVSENYEEGEIIYHKIWDDIGEVIEVGVTEDGIKKMKVNFEKVGLKILCMAHASH